MPKTPFYEIYQTPDNEEFRVHFQALFKLANCGTGESDTVTFANMLDEALEKSWAAKEESSKGHCAFDMVLGLAYYFRAAVQRNQGDWN